MNTRQKQTALQEGWILSITALWGDKWHMLRESIRKLGAIVDVKQNLWLFPTKEMWQETAATIGYTAPSPRVSIVPPAPLAPQPTQRSIPAPASLPPLPGKFAATIMPPAPMALQPAPMALQPASFPAPAAPPTTQPVMALTSPEPTTNMPPAPLAPQPTPLLMPVPPPMKIVSAEPMPVPSLTPPLAAKQQVRPVLRISAPKTSTGETVPLMQLPPCVLLTFTVELSGAVRHESIDSNCTEDVESTTVEGKQCEVTNVTRLSTSRHIIKNVKEHEEATYLSGVMRTKVRKLCRCLHAGTYICTKEKEAELDQVIIAARQQAAEWNARATHHFLRVSTLKAAITSDSDEAARAMALTAQELLARIEEAVNKCDIVAIRQAAREAGTIVPILNSRDGVLIEGAIEEARRVAKQIRKRLEQTGGDVERVLREVKTSKIDEARMAFIEYDIPVEVKATRDALETARFAELDLAPDTVATANGAVDTGRFSDL